MRMARVGRAAGRLAKSAARPTADVDWKDRVVMNLLIAYASQFGTTKHLAAVTSSALGSRRSVRVVAAQRRWASLGLTIAKS